MRPAAAKAMGCAASPSRLPWIAGVVLCLASGCTPAEELPSCPLYTIRVGGKELKVEVARNREKREAGLAFRKAMPINQGMLFVFPYESYQSFWMKNTFVPLSLAFLNAEGEIVQIETMAPESLQSHRSSIRVRYVLEVTEGWFERNGIRVGDRVEIPPEIAVSEDR